MSVSSRFVWCVLQWAIHHVWICIREKHIIMDRSHFRGMRIHKPQLFWTREFHGVWPVPVSFIARGERSASRHRPLKSPRESYSFNFGDCRLTENAGTLIYSLIHILNILMESEIPGRYVWSEWKKTDNWQFAATFDRVLLVISAAICVAPTEVNISCGLKQLQRWPFYTSVPCASIVRRTLYNNI